MVGRGFINNKNAYGPGNTLKLLPETEDGPLALSISTDRTVLLAALVNSVLTGVIFGILPA
jgi:hypothetical protein